MLQNVYILFNINDYFTDVQVTHTMRTNTPQYHHTGWLLTFSSFTFNFFYRMDPFFFTPQSTMSMISQNNLKCGLVTAKFSTLHQSILHDTHLFILF